MTETDVITELDLTRPWDQSDYVIGPAEMTARWLKASPAVLATLLGLAEPLAQWRTARTAYHDARAAYRAGELLEYPWRIRDRMEDAQEALYEALDRVVPE